MPVNSLNEAVERVLSATLPSQFTLELQLYSEQDTAYRFRPLFVESGQLQQLFTHNYMDDFTLSFPIASSDYAALYERAQGLLAGLTLTYLDTQAERHVYTPPPLVRQYRVLLVDPTDVTRGTYQTQSHQGLDRQAVIRLISDAEYRVRQKHVHGLFQNTTMEGMLRHLARCFGFTTVVLTPPDNTHSYQNLVLPPSQGFPQAFDYLQATYGVYLKGLRAYATGDTLYLYQPFDTKPRDNEPVIVYRARDDRYAGRSSYHSGEPVKELVLTNASRSVDLTRAAAENQGTGVMFLRSGQLIDQFATTDQQGSRFNEHQSVVVNNAGARPAVAGAHNTRYERTTDNLYQIASRLAEHQAVLTEAVWSQARLFSFTPGQAVRYLYDDDLRVTTVSGVVEAVRYQIARTQQGPRGMIYACQAQCLLRTAVAPDS